MKEETVTDARVVNHNLVVTPGHHQTSLSISEWLEQELLLPHGFVTRLFDEGLVRVGGQAVSRETVLSARTKIWLMNTTATHYNASTPAGIGDSRIDVLYEDDHVLVVDKPAGLLVHSDGTEVKDTLIDRVRQYLGTYDEDHDVTHVHRLDRDTTGCILFAKHPFAARALDAMMTVRQIRREYLAVVFGKSLPKRGTWNLPIGRDRHRSGAYIVSRTGKPAVTNFERHWHQEFRELAQGSTIHNVLSVITCTLATGRTHQIRVHVSAAGCPIVGDALYGGASKGQGWSWAGLGQALHARRMEFVHPYTKEQIVVEAPLPKPMSAMLKELGCADTYLKADG
ncbi:RluA family pseudouridine synthase [Alicyclobacillus ferrooxydans]|uniref:RluA family pseudouridine synthase n=1 Tax=Alicyclobacillus ferrooxydans TaxID=471514 RepID=UPI0006D55F23|nr:RluA family pseudouridine synthase [Alicyclobacillus ferrooxydans]